MTTTEKLQAIRAKCVELLEIAEKRTPGRWKQGDDNHESVEIGGIVGCCYLLRWNNGQGPNDAAFIASCAGPAEAGWRATIGRIDNVLRLQGLSLSPCDGGSCMVATDCDDQIQAIIGHEVADIIKAWEGLV